MSVKIENNKHEAIYKEDTRIKLKEFRKAVQDILGRQHHDQFLYRWLKARDFDVAKAEKMIRGSFKFRQRIGADTILTSAYTLPEVFLKYRTTAMLGLDNEKSPVRAFIIGICDCKGFLNALPPEEWMRLFIYSFEQDMHTLEENGTPDAKITFIFDYINFSLKNFYHKSVISATIQLIRMYQDNYPEVLKIAYNINLPSYYKPVFGIFKPFIYPATLSKLKFYEENEHQEELRKIMDPKILPAFMGGDRTDPDGDPKCRTLFDWDSQIDPSYYMKERRQKVMDDSSMKSKVIQPRSFFQVPIKVFTTQSILKWKFTTKDYNIRFGVFFKTENSQSNLEEILPVEVVDCQIITEDNEIVCEKDGTYVLHFDNTHSWLTSKQVWYKIEVVKCSIAPSCTD